MSDFVTIDLGSSQASFCLFSSEGVQRHELNEKEWGKVSTLPGILSSVRSEKTLLDRHPYLNDDHIFRIGNYFRKGHFLDMPIQYSETLGQDRLACAYWAWKNRRKGNVYIIDAGTFLTVDKVSDKGFEGGFIFPGIQTLLNSYTAAENLPRLADMTWKAKEDLPQNTKAAMLNAIELMYTTSLKETLKEPNAVFLTGGEGQTIGSLLIKNKVEFQLSPYLIHLGLAQCFHSILEDK